MMLSFDVYRESYVHIDTTQLSINVYYCVPHTHTHKTVQIRNLISIWISRKLSRTSETIKQTNCYTYNNWMLKNMKKTKHRFRQMCYVNSCAVKINICVTISNRSVNNSIQLIPVSLFAFVVASFPLYFRYLFPFLVVCCGCCNEQHIRYDI